MTRINNAKSWIASKWNQVIALAKENKYKTAASLIILSMGITGTALASHYYNSNTNTLYLVYLDGKEIGTIDNPEVINQYLDKQIIKDKEKYPSLKISLGNQLEFKEESKFKGEANNDQALQAFAEQLKLTVPAEALIINGKPVAYSADESTIQAVLKEQKDKYATAPADNEKKEVNFKEKVSVEESKSSPEQIMTKDQLKTFLDKGTLEQAIYKVQDGDTIEKIAKLYNLQVKEILQLNPGTTQDGILKVNQPLIVTAPKPLLTVETVVEKEVEETMDNQTKFKAADDLYRGDSQVVQEGQQGKKKVTYKIVTDNGERIEKTVLKEDIVSQPVDKVIKKGTKVKPSRGDGMFAWPTNGGYISSPFALRWGTFHKGIDIAQPSNRDIKAADNGRVVFAGWDTGGYGNCVRIDHDNGYVTVYGHLASIKVSVGDVIEKGENLGVMGSTGDSTGIHLHFEIQKDGTPINPLQFVSR